MQTSPLKYAPFGTSVDQAFWAQLADRKLNVYKLDETPHELVGYYVNCWFLLMLPRNCVVLRLFSNNYVSQIFILPFCYVLLYNSFCLFDAMKSYFSLCQWCPLCVHSWPCCFQRGWCTKCWTTFMDASTGCTLSWQSSGGHYFCVIHMKWWSIFLHTS